MSKTPYVRPSLRPEYGPWAGMVKRYRGTGEVCARWLNFQDFRADMGARPPGTHFGRIDPTKAIGPGTCAWLTPPPPKPAREPTTAGTRRNPTVKLRPSTITIPKHAGPHVRMVFAEMRRQCLTYDKVEEMSGVLRATIKAWRSKNSPGLTSLEAVLNTLGFDFLMVPRARVLPAGLREDLEQVAARHGQDMAATVEEWVAIVSGARQREAERAAYADAAEATPPETIH